MHIHKVFRKLRREKEWTMDEVAMRLGVSCAVISDFEVGKRDLKWKYILELSKMHKLSPVIVFLMATEQKDQKKVKDFVKKNFK